MKYLSIYFIGRKQGIGLRRYRLSHLENRRKYEYEGFQDAYKSIRQVRLIQNADVVWVRVRPEHTTDYERIIIEKRLKAIRGKVPIINDINIFDNYDCKNLSFNIWKNNNIQCPNHIIISINKLKNNISNMVKIISEFIEQNNTIFLRTNNETNANGMVLLTALSTDKEIKKALNMLIDRCQVFLPNRKSTQIIGVEYITPNNNQYQDIYRVHILFNKVLSFYAVTSKNIIFHNIDMVESDIERFIQLNRDLCQKMPELEEIILKSAHSLGCNLGAVEFFIKNEKPILLELNPMWGGHASKHGFGNTGFQNYLKENRSDLEKEILNVYNFMDRRSYYKNLYEHISYHVLNKI